jgi:hypothetical protein
MAFCLRRRQQRACGLHTTSGVNVFSCFLDVLPIEVLIFLNCVFYGFFQNYLITLMKRVYTLICFILKFYLLVDIDMLSFDV